MNTYPSILVRIAFHGGLMVLAATVWAWAVGANPWHGVAVGVLLGLGTGIFLGLSLGNEYDEQDLELWGHVSRVSSLSDSCSPCPSQAP